MLISYNWLKSYIPEIPEAEKITELLTFKLCEVEDVEKLENGDSVFNLKILPDRAHDLLSHQGVAREIAGLLGIEFKLPDYTVPDHQEKNSASESSGTNLKIEIQTPACRRYMGRIVRGIKVGPSPEWMVNYLSSIGQRSINNVVDATNIVMFDCGQPIHAFDLQQVDNEKIVIRKAIDDEEIELVGSEKLKVKLKESDIMINNGVKNLALAGIKGGLDSGVFDKTVDLLIEVANFKPSFIRKTAKRLGVSTDASKRFEHDLSPSLCDFAMMEISALIYEMFPGALFEEIIDIYPQKEDLKRVRFRSSDVSKILGIKIKDEEIEKILKNYNYLFSHESEMWDVEVPEIRLDINSPRDFVEEIGRVYGYEKIIPEIPKIDYKGKDDIVWQKINFIKKELSEQGYREVMTYGFCSNGEVEVLASASDKNFLRSNLKDSLNESINLNLRNLPLLGIDEVKLFEIGTVFNKKGEEIHVAYGNKKEIKEMTLDDYIKSVVTGFSPDMIIEITKPQVNEKDQEIEIFKPWSVFPFVVRDIAVWVPEDVKPEKLVKIYKDFGTELLVQEPKLFDSFTKPASTQGGNGKTSFAYRLVFQSYEKTLTDEEINNIMLKINEKIISLGWEVR